jgi:RNA polymerase sigma-70 factor (ECF subfamily)
MVYDETFTAIRAYCIRRLPVSEVNDAVAEVYAIAWRRMDDIPDGEGARLWLFGIARNVIRNTTRSMRRRERLNWRLLATPSASSLDPETIVVRRSEDNRVLEALSHLRESDRELLRLRVWEDLTTEEIASVLDIDRHAVSMRFSRARSRLAKRLDMDESTTRPTFDPHPVREGGDSQ